MPSRQSLQKSPNDAKYNQVTPRKTSLQLLLVAFLKNSSRRVGVVTKLSALVSGMVEFNLWCRVRRMKSFSRQSINLRRVQSCCAIKNNKQKRKKKCSRWGAAWQRANVKEHLSTDSSSLCAFRQVEHVWDCKRFYSVWNGWIWKFSWQIADITFWFDKWQPSWWPTNRISSKNWVV